VICFPQRVGIVCAESITLFDEPCGASDEMTTGGLPERAARPVHRRKRLSKIWRWE
jgi:hypothetical protein